MIKYFFVDAVSSHFKTDFNSIVLKIYSSFSIMNGI
jgi:hypothetical protein